MKARLVRIASACLALIALQAVLHAQGYSPEEARSRMVLPPGFKAELFASEPLVRQPLSGCFDERGRMWVIEYLQYPVPAGLKPVTVDVYLRTEYDRVPEPPPRGPRGADRIKILEDTDGDGRADKSTVFVDGLNLASGLALGYGGVWVGQAPYLLFYPDKDKDDKPDGDPEIRLSGFGLQDAHSTVNSMNFGPDGWLYGAQGSTVTARIRGVEFQQGIWRYHPVKDKFELFAEGGGNTWGLDWDETGNAFGSSNGAFITFHMVQGGYYWKGFAKHGPLHNPRTYGYFNSIDYTGRKLGGHVTPGGIIYQGDAYPPEFRNAFIGGNLLANAVYWHRLKPSGSTFQGEHGGVLIESRDDWFRPIDLFLGPDGCVYVVDWYDKRASHLDPRDNWDKTNGRIYRIVYGERKRIAPFDLSKLSSVELVATRNAENDWRSATARRLLAERRDASLIPALRQSLRAEKSPVEALRDLWALNLSGGFDDAFALELLSHPIAAVRRWTVRLLGDDARMNASLSATLRDLAENDTDPLVRSQLASSAQRWKSDDAFPILEALMSRRSDLEDTHIPMLLWWAFERKVAEDHDAMIRRMTRDGFQSIALAREVVLERLARLLVSSGREADDQALARLINVVPGEKEFEKIVAGMEKGIEGRVVDRVPKALETALERLIDRPKPDVARIRLAASLGHKRGLEAAMSRARDAGAPEAERSSLIEVIGRRSTAESLKLLLDLASAETRGGVRAAALNALGAFDRPEIAETLLSSYSKTPAGLKSRVIDLLCTRKPWASRLVDELKAGRLPTKDVSAAQVTRIVLLNDANLKRRVEEAWGRIPGPNSPEKIRRIAEIRGLLPEGDKGNAGRGKPIFTKHCAVCHKLFNEGENIGPELTGSERGSLDFLLASLVDPSALIRKEYQARTVAAADGRVLSGLILEENDKAMTLIDSKREKTVIPLDKIVESKPSNVSLMPEGLLDPLRDDEIRDLFRYLQSSGPAR